MKKDNAFLDKIPTPFQQFFQRETLGGMVLVISALIAFIIANTGLSDLYFEIKKTYTGLTFGDWELKMAFYHWINDGLMVIFFLMVGLEIKRELLIGELSKPRDAALSAFAAIGGMVVPALIYVAFNYGGDGIDGWGIPMATDIAFAIGMISLLGPRVPLSLKVFLTALAIVDDLGAILVIAVFYTQELSLNMLFCSLGIFVALSIYCLMGGRSLMVYMIVGIFAWYFMLKSGVHATVAGVLLAFTVPLTREKKPEFAELDMKNILHGEDSNVEMKMEKLAHVINKANSPLMTLEHKISPLVAFLILPLFAFFNAGVEITGESATLSPIVLGCALGLLIGKPIGIVLFAWISTKLNIASLPADINWKQIFGTGVLAGIGFTMSFFIATLAFQDEKLLDQSKIGILAASVIAAISGLIILGLFTKKSNQESEASQ